MNSCAFLSILKYLLFFIPIVLSLAALKNHLESFFKMLTPVPSSATVAAESRRVRIKWWGHVTNTGASLIKSGWSLRTVSCANSQGESKVYSLFGTSVVRGLTWCKWESPEHGGWLVKMSTEHAGVLLEGYLRLWLVPGEKWTVSNATMSNLLCAYFCITKGVLMSIEWLSSPKIHTQWGLRVVIRSWGWCPNEWDWCSYKWDTTGLYSPSHMRIQMSVLTRPGCTLNSDFQFSELWEISFYCS